MDKELIEQLKKCKTAEEVFDKATALKFLISKEQAKEYFEKYCNNKEGEISDNELNNVAGGTACYHGDAYDMKYWETKSQVQFIRQVGDLCEIYDGRMGCDCTTTQCKVVSTNIETCESGFTVKFYDAYLVIPTKDYGNETMTMPHYRGGWVNRHAMEK